MTTRLFRKAIAKPLAALANQTEQSILKTLNTPKVGIKHQFSIAIPKLGATIEDPVSYCQELANKVKISGYMFVSR